MLAGPFTRSKRVLVRVFTKPSPVGSSFLQICTHIWPKNARGRGSRPPEVKISKDASSEGTVSGDFSLAQKCITRDVTKDPVTCGIYRFFPCGDFTRCLGMKKSLAGDFQLENVQTHYASRNAVPFLRDRSLREPVTLSQRSHKDASL